ncbi:hypothetical protein CAPTEDRAFT_213147 [Capitella teleta]|uniref:BTB domain-containing protein n=1 Tax=Capitella teleta TaxID=283909 RepID=R7U2W3_CAPTE|nr:hypothetical protein CAPTEDRAFT_213147 [Capitella teleta]|eukprot:ELT97520.1 hypothetical protein CAPTEDRAFT_213147 [Capitella teleta]
MAVQNREVDWQVNRSVLECNRYMWEKKIATDVEFEVGTTAEQIKNIRAHKYVLMSRSPVFEAMFNGGLSKNTGDLVQITDVDSDAFNETLKYIYFEKAEINSQNVLATLYASKKYVLPLLTAQCKDFLAKNLHLESVCSILDQSIFYDEQELTQKCLHYMAPVIKEVFATEGFLKMSQPALKALMQDDYLFCESEVIVYDACLRWAEAQCNAKRQECTEGNIRAMLDDVIYHIRFPIMQDVEFARVVGKSNILSASEKSDIYYYLLTQDGSSMKFGCTPRVSICARFPVLGTAQQWWSCNGPTDAFSFQGDKDLDVIGVTVYGGKEKAQHTVCVEIRDSSERVLSKSGAVTFESDGSPSPIPIYLPTPAQVRANQTYTVMVTMRGPLTHYGSGGQEVLSCAGINLKFFTSSKSTNGTNTKSGQIPQLVFIPRQHSPAVSRDSCSSRESTKVERAINPK